MVNHNVMEKLKHNIYRIPMKSDHYMYLHIQILNIHLYVSIINLNEIYD